MYPAVEAGEIFSRVVSYLEIGTLIAVFFSPTVKKTSLVFISSFTRFQSHV